MQMSDLFTAQYSDGETVREITIDAAYKQRGARRVTFSPAVIVRRVGDFFTVDFDGRGIGCTLATAATFSEAQALGERYGDMTPQEFAAALNVGNPS